MQHCGSSKSYVSQDLETDGPRESKYVRTVGTKAEDRFSRHFRPRSTSEYDLEVRDTQHPQAQKIPPKVKKGLWNISTSIKLKPSKGKR